MSIQQIILNTISDLKNELNPSSTKSIKTLGYYQAGDGGHGCYYWKPFQLKINYSSGYAIGPDQDITVESLSEPIEKGSVIEFTGGGSLTLTKDASTGETVVTGGVTNFALIDDEEGGLQDDSGLSIKPTFGGFSGAGRWGLVHEGTIYAKQFGIKTDGTEQASEIQSAIMSCPKGCTFKFNPGTYVVENEIVLTSKKRLKIDGNGAFLDASSWNSSGTSYLFRFEADVIASKPISSVSRYSITIDGTFASPPVAGQWIQIDSTELAGNTDYGVGRNYTKSQAAKVASVNSSVVTLEPTTPIIFAGGTDGNYLELEAYKYSDLANNSTSAFIYDYNEDVIIRNLNIELNKTTQNLTQGGINLAKCLNWTITDCNIRNSTRDCVTAIESIFGRVQNCIFTTSDNGLSSGTYGVHLRKSYHCIVAHNTIDAYKALDCDSSFYVTFDNNNCNGALRPHGSLFVVATDNVLKGSSFPWRAGYSKIQGNTFYCHDASGRGFFLGEMANTFGNIEIRDNTFISTHEYSGIETKYAIEIDSSSISNIIIDGNLIKNFARGIFVPGADTGNNLNLQITNNRIEVYSRGISGLRYKPAILSNNVFQKLVHTKFPSSLDFDTTDVNTGADSITFTSHFFYSNQVVRFTSTGALPAGLVTSTNYYIIVVDDNTIKVSLSPGGAAIDLTGTGTGTHTLLIVGAGTAISFSSGGSYTPDETIVKNNTILGSWDIGWNISTDDYTGILAEDNFIDDAVSTKLNSSSTGFKKNVFSTGFEINDEVYTKRLFGDNIERSTFVLIGSFTTGNKISISFTGASQRPLDVIKVRIATAQNDSGVSARRAYLEKTFRIVANSGAFMINDSTLIDSFQAVNGDLSIAHIGSNYEYSITFTPPASYAAAGGGNTHTIDLEIMTSRLKAQYPTPNSIITSEPKIT